MGPDQNEELLRYYNDRRVWLLEADEIPPQLAPYPCQTRWAYHRRGRPEDGRLGRGGTPVSMMLNKPRPLAEAIPRLPIDSAQLEPSTTTPDSASAGEASGVYLPEESRSERYIAIGLFLLSFLYLCIFRRYTLDRSRRGNRPARSAANTGRASSVSGLLLILHSWIVLSPTRCCSASLEILCWSHTRPWRSWERHSPVITYLLSRRVCSREIALLVTGLMTITALPFRFMVLHNWDSTLLACLALYCAVRLAGISTRGVGFCDGSLVSLTGLFEQSKGAGLLLGLGLGFLIIALRGRACGKSLIANCLTRRMFALAIWPGWPYGGHSRLTSPASMF